MLLPAEHRALRELHATTRQLESHWAKLARRLGDDLLAEGAQAAHQLLDVGALGVSAAEASAAMHSAGVAATGRSGWGAGVAARHVRFVFSAEPVSRLESFGERLQGTTLAAAASR